MSSSVNAQRVNTPSYTILKRTDPLPSQQQQQVGTESQQVEAEPQRDKILKHILCNSIQRGVVCPHHRTGQCWYAHSESERSEHLIKKPCRYARADGTCSVKNCKFDHSILPAPSPSVSFEQRTESPFCQALVRKPCRFVQPDGTCMFGPGCRFDHTLSVEQYLQDNQAATERIPRTIHMQLFAESPIHLEMLINKIKGLTKCQLEVAAIQ
jgi:hypothetical protein